MDVNNRDYSGMDTEPANLAGGFALLFGTLGATAPAAIYKTANSDAKIEQRTTEQFNKKLETQYDTMAREHRVPTERSYKPQTGFWRSNSNFERISLNVPNGNGAQMHFDAYDTPKTKESWMKEQISNPVNKRRLAQTIAQNTRTAGRNGTLLAVGGLVAAAAWNAINHKDPVQEAIQDKIVEPTIKHIKDIKNNYPTQQAKIDHLKQEVLKIGGDPRIQQLMSHEVEKIENYILIAKAKDITALEKLELDLTSNDDPLVEKAAHGLKLFGSGLIESVVSSRLGGIMGTTAGHVLDYHLVEKPSAEQTEKKADCVALLKLKAFLNEEELVVQDEAFQPKIFEAVKHSDHGAKQAANAVKFATQALGGNPIVQEVLGAATQHALGMLKNEEDFGQESIDALIAKKAQEAQQLTSQIADKINNNSKAVGDELDSLEKNIKELIVKTNKK